MSSFIVLLDMPKPLQVDLSRGIYSIVSIQALNPLYSVSSGQERSVKPKRNFLGLPNISITSLILCYTLHNTPRECALLLLC